MVTCITRGSNFLFLNSQDHADYLAVNVNDDTVKQFFMDDFHNWGIERMTMPQLREKVAQFIETFSIF